jgi:hypothetical protein
MRRLGQAALHETVEARKQINELLLNANTTTLAALELWRRGFPLQVGILLRNVVEVLATAVAINSDSGAYKAYERGKFTSSKAFTIVKRVWPMVGTMLGRLNGGLSDEFIHVGRVFHRQWRFVTPELNEGDMAALTAMLMPLKAAFHSLDLISELTCYDFEADPRYFTRLEAGVYQYRPTADAEAWMAKFLTGDVPDKRDR